MLSEQKQPAPAETKVEEASATAIYEQAAKFYYEKQYNEALTCLNMALEINPSFGKAYYLRAEILSEHFKKYPRAIADYGLSYILNSSANKNSNEYISILEKTAHCYSALGCQEAAISILTEAVNLAKNPELKSTTARFNLHTAHLKRGMMTHPGSDKDLYLAIAYDDKNALVTDARCEKLLFQAISYCNPVTFILAHIKEDKNIQIALLKKCKFEDNLLGKVCADKYEKLSASLVNLDWIFHLRKIDAELAKLRETPLKEITPKNDVHAEIKTLCEEATTYINDERYSEVMATCVKIIALDSRNKEAYYLICRAQTESANRKSNAVIGIVAGLIFLTLEKLSTEPDVNKIYNIKNYLSLISYYLKNWDQAVEYATEMIQGNQNAGSVHLTYSHYLRANAYLDQGKVVLAIMDCRKALELSSTFDTSAEYVTVIPRLLETAVKSGKKAIFESIKQIESLDTQMALLEKCMDPRDLDLGTIFWDPTFRSCSLESGTLKMVKEYHASLQKQLQPSEEKQPDPNRPLSSASSSILFPRRSSVEPNPADVPMVVFHASQNDGP